MDITVGIDPGQHGGIAALYGGLASAWVMPMAGKDVDGAALAELLFELLPGEMTVWVEKVHSMPKQGVASTFKFGRNYGIILGVLAGMGLSCRLVTPQAWKKVVLAGTEKEKCDAVAYCRMRWPHIDLVPPRCRKAHDGMADALCIAAYGTTQSGASS